MISVEVPSETVTIESLRETELAEARAIQLAMLASEGLHTPQVAIESEFQPVTEVGGDFLDVSSLPTTRESDQLRPGQCGSVRDPDGRVNIPSLKPHE